MAAFGVAAAGGGHPLGLVESLHAGGGVAGHHRRSHPSIGNAVVVPSHVPRVVPVYPHLFPLGNLIKNV
jgi:hypothetical protein